MTEKRPTSGFRDGAPAASDDPDAPPSEEERIASERLRDALADPTVANPDAELARALALAHAPREIEPAEHQAIVAKAVLRAGVRAEPRGRVLRVVFGVGTALALAAAIILVVRKLDMTRSASVATPTAAALVPARSTQELFDEPFAKPLSKGAASARIDRIAMARGGDLRENRFAMWGVR